MLLVFSTDQTNELEQLNMHICDLSPESIKCDVVSIHLIIRMFSCAMQSEITVVDTTADIACSVYALSISP
jgi:hypothetical protein